MGYQVGNTCYDKRELAENAYFSQVSPVITADGLKSLTYNGQNWYYGSQKLTANLPVCDVAENYKAGQALAYELLPTAAVLMVAGILIRLFR